MENNTTTLHQPEPQWSESDQPVKRVNRRIAICILILSFIFAILFYFKGLLVAATVDGKLISRLSVIRQLEKQGGKNALDSLIVEKLIENEAKKKGVVISNDEVDKEIKNIEALITKQGSTLQNVLIQKGLTEETLRTQLRTQKKIEKLLADKIQVTDTEVSRYVLDNKIPLPKGKEAEIKKQVADQLHNKKLNQEAQQWLAGLRVQAKIKYYVNY